MVSRFKALKNIIFLSTAVALSIYIGIAFHISTKINIDNRQKADTIIVLGSHILKQDGNLNPCLHARVKHGAELYKGGLSDLIIMTGGTDKETDLNEASEMKKLAISLGIPEGKIMTENRASSTYENLYLSKLMMNYRDLEDAIVVTENYHMPRTKMVSDKLEIKSYISPVTNSECWNKGKYRSLYFLKEPLAIALYKLTGKL